MKILVFLFSLFVGSFAFAGSFIEPVGSSKLAWTRAASGEFLNIALSKAARKLPENVEVVGSECLVARGGDFECVLFYRASINNSALDSTSSDGKWIISEDASGNKFYHSKKLDRKEKAREARELEMIRRGDL